jgi:hypothetical protein
VPLGDNKISFLADGNIGTSSSCVVTFTAECIGGIKCRDSRVTSAGQRAPNEGNSGIRYKLTDCKSEAIEMSLCQRGKDHDRLIDGSVNI